MITRLIIKIYPLPTYYLSLYCLEQKIVKNIIVVLSEIFPLGAVKMQPIF